MTVDVRPDGTHAFHCDTCPDSIGSEHDHFHSALEEIKAKGWRTYQGPDQKWAHSCPACVEQYAKEQR